MRNATAKFLKFLGIFQEVDQLIDLFFCLITTCNIGKGYCVAVFIDETGFRFTKGECATLTATLHLAHHEKPETNDQ